MLYELVCGRLPWTGTSPINLLDQIGKFGLVFPSDVIISSKLQELIKKMLTVDEKLRIEWKELFNHELFN